MAGDGSRSLRMSPSSDMLSVLVCDLFCGRYIKGVIMPSSSFFEDYLWPLLLILGHIGCSSGFARRDGVSHVG